MSARALRTGIRRGLLSRSGLAARLLIAQSLVLVAGAVTTWIVASLVGPTIFHDHLAQAGVAHSATESRHVEEAFSSALLVSIALALLAAMAAALTVTWYFTRRVQRSINAVALAATGIAAGKYSARVPEPGLGAEFATLADTYNQLAKRLEATEVTRRRMLADLAHEMRTPLATIDAHLEGIEDGVREPDATSSNCRARTPPAVSTQTPTLEGRDCWRPMPRLSASPTAIVSTETLPGPSRSRCVPEQAA